jgi:hypothetical protein
MLKSRSAGIERSRRSPIVRPESSTETARSRFQTRKRQEHLKRNRRLQYGRTWWEMWVSEKTYVHHEATASICMGNYHQNTSHGEWKLRASNRSRRDTIFSPEEFIQGTGGNKRLILMVNFSQNTVPHHWRGYIHRGVGYWTQACTRYRN